MARVAVVQAGSILFDPEASIEKAGRLTAEAAAAETRLVVFPEAFIGGYPKGEDFGARVGSRTPEGRKLFRRYFEAPWTFRGPARRGGAKRPAPPAPGW
jgi:nitrilase